MSACCLSWPRIPIRRSKHPARNLFHLFFRTLLERYASGFHVCGYGTTGIPEFWFISNILEMDDFVYTRMALRYSPPSPDFLDRDAKALGWNGHDSGSIKNGVQFYRNGDYRLHAAAWHRLD